MALYNLGIRLYFLLIYFASFFNKKAGLWVNGRTNQNIITEISCVWFHFSSLGEFEQGRPVLEHVKTLYPGKKIVVTFFSPSGYEIRKNTPLADCVYYLPLDTSQNAADFIAAIKPTMVIFTKYEYWYHYFNELHKRNVPLYMISGIFRPNQIFFRWYGGLNRKILSFVTHFFVQDEQSKQLLGNINITNVTISGDTRFDRVWTNALQPKALPIVEEFKNEQKIFIAGSTWPPDEELIAGLVNDYPNWKFIIAPHEISDDKINKLISLLPANAAIRYSQLSTQKEAYIRSRILIIDNIGMLSALYQYGDIAYIGGGFGAGIHNTLEAAAFGLPVIFGPKYDKFKEAKDVIALNAGFTIGNLTELKQIAGILINDVQFYTAASDNIKTYVAQHTGATKAIVDFITT